MESIDIKTIVYFIIAVLWLLFNSYKKSQQKARKNLETHPPLSNKDIKEIVEDKTNASKKFYEEARATERVKKLKNKKKASKIPATTAYDSFSINNRSEDESHLLGISDIDPRNMVIYSTIFKRPEY